MALCAQAIARRIPECLTVSDTRSCGFEAVWHLARGSQAHDRAVSRLFIRVQHMDPGIGFPRELLDLTVSHLEKEDLATCTLLSRSWRLSTHVMLFRSLSLHTHWHHVEPGTHGEGQCCRKDLGIDAFIQSLLNGTCSSVAPFVKELDLDFHSFSLTTSKIDIIVTRLPALEILRMTSVLLAYEDSTELASWSSPRPLKQLCLSLVEFLDREVPSGTDDGESDDLTAGCILIELLRMFGSIDRVDLRAISFIDDDDRRGLYWRAPSLAVRATSDMPKTFCIRALQSHYQADETQLDALALLKHSHALDNLRSLDIEDNEDTYKAFIPSVGSTLFRLRLTFDRWLFTLPVEVWDSSSNVLPVSNANRGL
ncbi:hypothetical protein EIP91_001992 [Steccherinum ochraceum]|uniref:F-box domain-containing protein n=1 Tax=Steccherinum ochraceum TaxID=92696 RepID=A0A4R0RTN6_9APHY|nr:hypothetical protein EIP91_001992 [Steccherinum ochraceum]